MSMLVKDVKAWLDTLVLDDAVGIAEEGLTLVCDQHPEFYLEVGGLTEEDEDEMP